MALYYEMMGDLDKAITSLEFASQLALKPNKRDGMVEPFVDTALVVQYKEVLRKRLQEIAKITLCFDRRE